MPTKVKAHLRRGNPVREHLRFRRLTVKLYKRGSNPQIEEAISRIDPYLRDRMGAFVTNRPDDPTIYIVGLPRFAAAEDVASVISHETLHKVLDRIGEDEFSTRLDARKTPELYEYGEDLVTSAQPTGLYKYAPKKPSGV